MSRKASGIEPRRPEALEVRDVSGEEVSLLAIGTTLVRSRWRVVRWMLAGGLIAGLMILPRPRTYLASASFIAQGDASRSGLATLAGQIGINVPSGDESVSADFYLSLLHSRVLLLPVTRDTLVVPEEGGKRITMLDLLEVPQGPLERREELAVTALQRMIAISITKSTGVVSFSVPTKWRSVSLAIVTALLNGVNDYNERIRQNQASAERKFTEGRLNLAGVELRDSENHLADFLKTNRNWSGSPDLYLAHERLERELQLRQQVFTTLTQAYEEARIREVRDTPVITVFEPPSAPTVPQPRGLLIGSILGAMLGLLIGILLSLTSGLLTRRQQTGNSEAEEFANALREAKGQLFGRVGRRSRMGTSQ